MTPPETARPAGPEPAAAVPAAPATARESEPGGETRSDGKGAPARATVPAREPVLAEQSREDTDAGWGEYPGPSDDRLYRDRPPHWDDF